MTDEDVKPKDTAFKDRSIDVSISSLLSLAAVGSILWAFMKPAIIEDIREELEVDNIKQELMEAIRQDIIDEQRPLRNAYKEILQSGINVNRRAIAKLEYDRDHGDNWSAERAGILADRYIEIQAQERAYNGL
jgi:hypothetical protein